jgi:serine protease
VGKKDAPIFVYHEEDAMNRKIFPLLSSIILSALLLYSLISLLTQAAQAASPDAPVLNLIHVPGDYPTIQAAINASVSGDTILVASGTYLENIDYLAKDITITSESGPQATIIDGQYYGSVVQIGPNGKLIGFKITHGYGLGAGAVVFGNGTIIRHNIFDTNQQYGGYWGAAIGGNSASPQIEANIFVNNNCDQQYISGVVAFVNDSEPQIVNNIFVDNPCWAINLTLPDNLSPRIINNTIVGNRIGMVVHANVFAGNQIYRNNIIEGNEIGLSLEGSPENYPTWDYNLVYSNAINYDGIPDQTELNGNISENPQFVDPLNGNFLLLAQSPAIDAGTNTLCPVMDYQGFPRPMDGNGDGVSICDMGAYEFAIPLSSVSLDGPTDGKVQSSYTFTATVSPITATLPSLYVWQATGQMPVTHSDGITDTFVFSWELPGTQVVTVTATNPLGSVSDTHLITVTDVPLTGLIAASDSPTLLGEVTTITATISAGTNVTYTWDFGDETFGSGATITHTYPAVEVYTATVTASNSINALSAFTVVDIKQPIQLIYLPLIRRN